MSRSRGYVGLGVGAIVLIAVLARFALRLERSASEPPEQPSPAAAERALVDQILAQLARDAGAVAPDPSIHVVEAEAYRGEFGRDLALSDDGLVLAIMGAPFIEVHERSAIGDGFERRARFEESASSLAITRDGTRLAAVDDDDDEIVVFRRDEAGWSEEARVALGRIEGFSQPAISADGAVVLAGAHVLERRGRRWIARERDVERAQRRLLVLSDDGRTGAECTSAVWERESGHVATFPVRHAAREARAPLPGICLGVMLARDRSTVTVLHQPFGDRPAAGRPIELLTYRVEGSQLAAPIRRQVAIDPHRIWVMKAADEPILLTVSVARACVFDASTAEPTMVRCDDIDSPVPERGAIAPNGTAWAVRSARGQVSVIDRVPPD